MIDGLIHRSVGRWVNWLLGWLVFVVGTNYKLAKELFWWFFALYLLVWMSFNIKLKNETYLGGQKAFPQEHHRLKRMKKKRMSVSLSWAGMLSQVFIISWVSNFHKLAFFTLNELPVKLHFENRSFETSLWNYISSTFFLTHFNLPSFISAFYFSHNF